MAIASLKIIVNRIEIDQ